MDKDRVEFLGLAFDPLDLDGAVARIAARAADAPFAYVVTPNVDHIVRVSREPDPGPVWLAYQSATLCLCDSRIVARLAKLSGILLPVVPGSDLTARLLTQHVRKGDRLCVIGGDAALAQALAALLPGCTIVQHIPPMGLRHNETALTEAATFAVAARARFTLLAVGSPQQELLAHRIAAHPGARGTGLCIGASIEFVIGQKARAPLWMQRASIEWLHRLLSEPRRLWRRYLIEGPRIFVLTWRWRRSR